MNSEWDAYWKMDAELGTSGNAGNADELEKFWNDHAPADREFSPERAVSLLLFTARQYETALLQIADKPQDHKALMDHREKTGQEPAAGDQQRWFAYLKTAHMAAGALNLSGKIFVEEREPAAS